MGSIAPVGLPVRTAGRHTMIHDGAGAARGFLWRGVTARRDGRIQPTPLCGPKIVAILKPRFTLMLIPIYLGGAADAER